MPTSLIFKDLIFDPTGYAVEIGGLNGFNSNASRMRFTSCRAASLTRSTRSLACETTIAGTSINILLKALAKRGREGLSWIDTHLKMLCAAKANNPNA